MKRCKKLNILGSEYEVALKKEIDEPKLKNSNGYTEFYAKKKQQGKPHKVALVASLNKLLKVLYRNLIKILITFLRIVHSCICKLLARKRNAESCL